MDEFVLRPQYHFRQSANGLLAWNVRRLINLSRGLPMVKLAIEQVAEMHENHWYTHEVPTPNSILEHLQLIEAADLRYPIIIDQAGRLMDGMHRLCKAKLQGQERIDCVQFTQDPKPDYIDCDPRDLPYD